MYVNVIEFNQGHERFIVNGVAEAEKKQASQRRQKLQERIEFKRFDKLITVIGKTRLKKQDGKVCLSNTFENKIYGKQSADVVNLVKAVSIIISSRQTI